MTGLPSSVLFVGGATADFLVTAVVLMAEDVVFGMGLTTDRGFDFVDSCAWLTAITVGVGEQDWVSVSVLRVNKVATGEAHKVCPTGGFKFSGSIVGIPISDGLSPRSLIC